MAIPTRWLKTPLAARDHEPGHRTIALAGKLTYVIALSTSRTVEGVKLPIKLTHLCRRERSFSIHASVHAKSAAFVQDEREINDLHATGEQTGDLALFHAAVFAYDAPVRTMSEVSR